MAKVDEIVGRADRRIPSRLFEHPYADENGIDLQKVTRQVARRWRQNRSRCWKTTAFAARRQTRVAVVGPTADDPLALLSGYSFPVH
jgi:beta-glucosidase